MSSALRTRGSPRDTKQMDLLLGGESSEMSASPFGIVDGGALAKVDAGFVGPGRREFRKHRPLSPRLKTWNQLSHFRSS